MSDPTDRLNTMQRCAHCGRRLTEGGLSHAEGRNRELQRCAPEETGKPYGLAAHPEGAPHPMNCYGDEAAAPFDPESPDA